MREAWLPFQSATPFDAAWFTAAFAATLPTLLLLHVLTGLAIGRYWQSYRHRETRHWHVLYTLVCPPLFADWQELYSAGGGDGLDSVERIRDCWGRTWSAYLSYIVLFVLESIVLSWPMVVLKIFVAGRKSAMEAALFPQLPEEDLSDANVSLILFTYCPLFLLVVPAIQIAMAHVYFRRLHPWAGVINNALSRREPNEKQGSEEREGEEEQRTNL